ncbi:MAG: superoxide dismutase family protein [Candidatus Velthaea sp.]
MTGSPLIRAAAALSAAAVLIGGPGVAFAAKAPTFMANVVDTTGKKIGFARFVGVDAGGTQITVDVSGLPPGKHGLHIHEFGSCNAVRDTAGVPTAFGGAGAHYDPAMTKMHKGPDGGGHAGDLPVLDVDDAGNARLAFYAAGLSVKGAQSIVGRAIVIHANPDDYTDVPPNGGSGARIACGEIGAATQ